MPSAKKSYVIDEETDRFIEKIIAHGRFESASYVLRAGLLLLESEEAKFDTLEEELALESMPAEELEELRRLIAEGDADFAAGRFHVFNSAEELTAEIMRRVNES